MALIRPIEWFEEGLKNLKASLAAKEREREMALKAFDNWIARTKEEIAFEEARIERAKKAGRTEFDANTYGRKRKNT